MIRMTLFLLLLMTVPARAAERDFDFTTFRQIPVLHEGRVKPLESFARAYLMAFYGRSALPDMSAAAWLAEVLLDTEEANSRQTFNVANPDVANALGLEDRAAHRYSFVEVSKALEAADNTIASIYSMEQSDRTPSQKQMLDLYFKVVAYAEISNSFSLQRTMLLRIIPPQWERDGDVWSPPWGALEEGQGSPQTADYLRLWRQLGKAYEDNDAAVWLEISGRLRDMAFEMAGARASPFKQKLEIFYHQSELFKVSLGLYLISFVMLMASFFHTHAALARTPYILVPLAAALQTIGIIMRMLIMGRPPVTTLYETTLFVSLIAVVLAALFEMKRKDKTGLLVSAIIGSVLLFISMRYAADGDTMEMLVAVLDTNFWLATHVVTITMGYGCALVAGTLGHIYLLQRLLHPEQTEMQDITIKNILAVGLIALFFSLLGTILGGIWADQSWGRFWGWDPKENGAMLIVLWLLWLLHGRIAGQLSPLNFATFMVFTNVIVILAWFGVNLLSIGLHSYGFTDSIAVNIALFSGMEVLFVIGTRMMVSHKERQI